MDLQIFERNGWEIRAIEKDGEPWFIGNDIAKCLGYSDPKKAVARHCKKSNDFNGDDSHPRALPVKIIPESDVYRLIMRSNLSDAEKFQDWVVEEVLPSIRKHGAYMTPAKIEEALLDPDTLIRLAVQLKEERAKRAEAEQRAIEMQPKADFVDEFVDATGLYTLTATAKKLKIQRKGLIDTLVENKYLFRRQKRLEPYADKIEKGLFEMKAGESNGHAYSQVYLTPKGLQHVVETFMPELA